MLSGPMGNGSPPVPPHAGVTVPWGVTARASRSGSPAGAGFAAPAVTCGGAATHTHTCFPAALGGPSCRQPCAPPWPPQAATPALTESLQRGP